MFGSRPAEDAASAAAGAAGRPQQQTQPLRTSRSLQAGQRPHVWLDAWSDPVAGVTAFSSCVHTCNVFGDGDWRLVVADADKKLKVWKGTQKASEHALLEAPVALTSFIADPAPPRVPVLAVASGPHAYLFKGLRPYYKFTLPPRPAFPEEELAWQQLDAGTLSPAAGAASLAALLDAGAALSARSLSLLAAAAPSGPSAEAAAAAFVAESRGQPLGRQSCITAMESVKIAVDEPDTPGCLVLGTEDGRVLILNQAGTAVQQTFELGSAPAFLAASGALEPGLRLSAATRDGRLHTLRGGEAAGAAAVQLESPAVGLVRAGASALVGCMNGAVHCYGGRGGAARQYTLQQPSAILAMQLLAAHTSRPAKCLLVALANGEVRVYNERSLVSVHTTAGCAPVTGLAFGRYAREDNTLVTITRGGGLDIKIMPRTASLEAPGGSSGPPPEQDVPLPVPAKTRLYVEQTQREREGAVDMHRHFQRGLVRARLATARALAKVLTDGQGAASHAPGAGLSMDASVEGLGPRFRLVVALANGGGAAVGGLVLVLQYDGRHASQQQLAVPMLVPMLQYELRVELRCLHPDAAAGGGGGDVRIVLVPAAGGPPVMSALVRMPLSEPEDIV